MCFKLLFTVLFVSQQLVNAQSPGLCVDLAYFKNTLFPELTQAITGQKAAFQLPVGALGCGDGYSLVCPYLKDGQLSYVPCNSTCRLTGFCLADLDKQLMNPSCTNSFAFLGGDDFSDNQTPYEGAPLDWCRPYDYETVDFRSYRRVCYIRGFYRTNPDKPVFIPCQPLKGYKDFRCPDGPPFSFCCPTPCDPKEIVYGWSSS